MISQLRRAVALVTGGAGFLGSHLCDRLIAEGKHVICLDNFLTGRRENISHLSNNPRFELIEADVCEPLPDLGVDEIWNLACPASPPRLTELAEMVIEMTGSASSIRRISAVIDDPKRRRPDIAVAKRDLDWRPAVELYAGLEKTIAYFAKMVLQPARKVAVAV